MANDIEIRVKLEDQASKPIGAVNDSLKSIGATADQTSKKTSSFADKFKANFLVIGAAATALIATFKNFVDAQAESEKASAKLTAALKNQGRYTDQAQKELEDYASALQQVTLYEDDQIKAVQARLVTTGLQGDALNEVTRLTLDFAAATGQDVESASMLFQKAATGNVAMLARYGVETKNADGTTKSFSQAVEELQKKYSGFSTELANTPSGKLVQLTNAFGDFKEVLGSIILNLIEPFVTFLTKLFYFFQGLPSPIQKLVGVFTVLGLAALSLIPIFTSLGIAINFATLGIPALIAGTILLVANIQKVWQWFNELPVVFKIIYGGIYAIVGAIKLAVDLIMKMFDLISNVPMLKGLFKSGSSDTKKSPDKKQNSFGADLNDFNKKDAKANEPLDLKKQLDDFTKFEMQKTNVLKNELSKRQMSQSEFDAWVQNQNVVKLEGDLKTTEAKLAALDAFQAIQYQKYSEGSAMRAQIDILYNEQKLALETQRIEQENALRDAQYLAEKNRQTKGLQDFKNMLDFKKGMTKTQAEDFEKWQNFMAGAVTSSNKEVAAIAKAMAIYNIGMNTIDATSKAMTGVPFPFNIPAMAATVAMGAQQMAQVQAMQPALAEGGMLRSTAGGRSVTVAEGGNDEAVVPLDDPATAQRLQNAVGGGSGQTIQLVVDNMVLAETVVQGYNKGQNIGRVSRLK